MLIKVPDDHKVGMRVPKGGSSCASCEYLKPGSQCSNEYWLKWHLGDPKLPAAPNCYCCDYYTLDRDD